MYTGPRGGRRDKLVKDQGRGKELIREVHRRRKESGVLQ